MSMVIPERTERKYEPYPEYKDSDVEWLREIPSGWGVRKLKYVGQALIGLTFQPSDVVDDSQGILVLRASNIQNSRVSTQDNVYVKTLIPKNLITRVGDILICSRSGSRDLIGKSAKITPDAAGVTFGAFMTVFRSQMCDFLYYVFNSQLFNRELGAFQTTTINQLTVNILNNFQVPIPPPAEQQAIAYFLDQETAGIDQLIARKQRLIELLQEQRTTLITHTVTKGLNPNVPMKDSGVEWLGVIPAHWIIKRLKYSVNLINDKVDGAVVDLPYIGLENVESWTGRLVEYKDIIEPEGTSNRFRTNDILFGKLRPYLAKVVHTEQEGICSSELMVLRPGKACFPRFLFYYLMARDTINVVTSATYGVKMPRANWQFISNLPFPTIEIDEQQAIADYLDGETVRIDSLIGRINQAIEKLQEYRSALITAAVAGKIDVRQNVS